MRFISDIERKLVRKGIASKLLKAIFKKIDNSGYYMYVSADIDNVDFYKKH